MSNPKSWYQTDANPAPADWRTQNSLTFIKRRSMPVNDNSKMIACDRLKEKIAATKNPVEAYYDDLETGG